MMGACSSTCCSKDSDELPKRNTESWGPMNERWGKAVLKNNLVGCQYVHADDPNVIDQVVNATTGERAIHVAVSTKNVALFQFLAQYQVDVNVQTVNHETPLHIAAKNNDTQSIKMLLALGADQDIKNGDNKLAKDLCDRNIRREFTKSKQKMLIKVGVPGLATSKASKESHDEHDIFIAGQSVHSLNLKKIKKLNSHVDSETEAAKAMRLKKEEIVERGDNFVSKFGRVIGCEIDEIAYWLEKTDEETRKELWAKVMRDTKQTSKSSDYKKIFMTLTYATLRQKQIEKGQHHKKKIQIDSNQIEYFVTCIKRHFPRGDKAGSKRVLKKSDFVKKLPQWMYAVHDDDDWKQGKM